MVSSEVERRLPYACGPDNKRGRDNETAPTSGYATVLSLGAIDCAPALCQWVRALPRVFHNVLDAAAGKPHGYSPV